MLLSIAYACSMDLLPDGLPVRTRSAIHNNGCLSQATFDEIFLWENAVAWSLGSCPYSSIRKSRYIFSSASGYHCYLLALCLFIFTFPLIPSFFSFSAAVTSPAYRCGLVYVLLPLGTAVAVVAPWRFRTLTIGLRLGRIHCRPVSASVSADGFSYASLWGSWGCGRGCGVGRIVVSIGVCGQRLGDVRQWRSLDFDSRCSCFVALALDSSCRQYAICCFRKGESFLLSQHLEARVRVVVRNMFFRLGIYCWSTSRRVSSK